MTGHIYGVISSFPCKITTTNISNSLVKICKRKYPNIINYNYDILNNYDTSCVIPLECCLENRY